MTLSLQGPAPVKPVDAAEVPRRALAGLDGGRVSISNPNAPGRAGINPVDTYM